MRVLTASFAVLFLCLTGSFANADEPAVSDADRPVPVGVISIASYDRFLGGVDDLFAMIEREDLGSILKGTLATVNNFDGMNKSAPFGAMVMMGTEMPPEPKLVVFLPISDIDTFNEAIAIGPIELIPVEGSKTNYTLILPENKFPARMKNGYLFLTDKEENFPANLPDPVAMTKTLSQRHDVAFGMSPGSIPEKSIDAMLDFARTSMEEETAEKQGSESEAEYELRKAISQDAFAVFEDLMNDADAMSIGWKFSKTDGFRVQFDIDTKAGTDLSKHFAALGQAAKAGGGVDLADVPGTAGLARLNLPVYPPLMKFLKGEANKAIADLEGKTPRIDRPLVTAAGESIRDNLDTETLQLTARMITIPPRPASLVVGMRMKSPDELLERAAKVIETAQNKYDAGQEIELDAAAGPEGIGRIHAMNLGEDDDDEVFGPSPEMAMAATKDRLWMTVGPRDEALAAIKTVPQPSESIDRSPEESVFSAMIHVGSVLHLGDDTDDEMLPVIRRGLSRGDDRIIMTVESAPERMTARLSFGTGIVQAFGLAAAAGFDEGN